MKTRLLYLIISLLSFLLFGCHEIRQQNETVYETCPKPTQCDYNPQKARAEITQSIDAPKGLFVSRTNNHYYMLSDDNIAVFDISDDKLNILTNIPYNLKIFYPYIDNEYNAFLKGRSIFEINDKIIFAIGTDNIYYKIASFTYPSEVWHYENDKKFNALLSVNINNAQLCYADISSDILFSEYTNNLYYDTNLKTLYTADKGSQNVIIHQYNLNNETQYFDDKNNNSYSIEVSDWSDKIFITKDYIMTTDFCVHGNGNIESYLYIRQIIQTEIFHKIDLTHLNLRYPPLSAFSDDSGDIWLYVREYDGETKQDKYELLKLKLL